MRSSQKFSTLEILQACITTNPNALRESGYTPESLYESSQLSFADKQRLRGRAQCYIMTRFKPGESEASVYEKSGDLLFSNSLPKQARQHWKIAFDNDHKPFDMTMNLGRQSLTQGYLNTACGAFGYLSQQLPHIPYLHNELGVARFMLATQENKTNGFVKHRLDALSAFDRALDLKPDSIVEQNKKVASLLTLAPEYGHPYRYLKFKNGSSTRMIDALMRDLSNNKEKSKYATGVGFTDVTHPDGSSSLEPVVTTTSYRVPVVPNELALYELTKLKQEQLSEEEVSDRMKFSK